MKISQSVHDHCYLSSKTFAMKRILGCVIFGNILVLLAGILLAGCGMQQPHDIPAAKPVDTSITKTNAFTDIFLDSASVYHFIAEKKLNKKDSTYVLSFYRQRNFQYAWFDSTGVAEQAYNFINLFRSYRESVSDSSLRVAAFEDAVNKWMGDSVTYKGSPSERVSFELMMTYQFFRYAERAYKGTDAVDPADLGWFIPRKKIDPVAFLDTVIISGGRDINQLVPVHPMFERLRKQLEVYTQLARDHSWSPIPFKQPKYTVGDSAAEIGLMKQRLVLLGDLTADDKGDVFTEKTKDGVISFQDRMGLVADGVAGKGFQAALNVPIRQRIEQILVNMERARWVPKPTGEQFIFVNIPEFKLHVFDSGKLQFEMAVVVGKPATNTAIFNGVMKYVVFAPYWNVPYSIVKNEMGRSAAYFSKRNMEIVGRYNDGLPMVRQKPGPANALGKVKFLFPNSYSIYLHDTPSKSLFGQNTRAFSHGCIRVADPFKLAHWVLRFNLEWPYEKIEEGFNYTKETTVTIAKPVPVFIGYFTSWVDQNGKLNFRNDIYGRDKKLADHLFPVAK